MKNAQFVFTLIMLAASNCFGQEAADQTESVGLRSSRSARAVNRSSILFTDTEFPWKFGSYQSTCHGTLPENEFKVLSEIGITKAEFAAGVGCVVGNWDDNDAMDFAFFKDGEPRKAMTLFYGDEGFLFSRPFFHSGYYFYTCFGCYAENGGVIVLSGAGHSDMKARFDREAKKWELEDFANP